MPETPKTFEEWVVSQNDTRDEYGDLTPLYMDDIFEAGRAAGRKSGKNDAADFCKTAALKIPSDSGDEFERGMRWAYCLAEDNIRALLTEDE